MLAKIYLYFKYFNKTKTLEYKVHRFVLLNKLKPRSGQQTKTVHPDVIKQLFLAENKKLRNTLLQSEFISIIDEHLETDEYDNYIINSNNKYAKEPIPKPPPIPEDCIIV